jgi:hypothetical protein
MRRLFLAKGIEVRRRNMQGPNSRLWVGILSIMSFSLFTVFAVPVHSQTEKLHVAYTVIAPTQATL